MFNQFKLLALNSLQHGAVESAFDAPLYPVMVLFGMKEKYQFWIIRDDNGATSLDVEVAKHFIRPPLAKESYFIRVDIGTE